MLTSLVACGLALPALAVPPEPAPMWLHVSADASLADAQALGAVPDHGRRVEGGATWQGVLLPAEAEARLRSAGFALRPRGTGHPRRTVDGYRLPATGDALLEVLAQAADPGGTAILGWSHGGRPLLGLWLGQPPGSGAPIVRVLGAHHGDEWPSFEVALALAEALVLDGDRPEIEALLAERTVWIVPYVNPDGVVAGTRWNGASVDLNRNYDFAWSPLEYRPGGAPLSEPETAALAAWAHYDRPLVGLSLHSGATNIGYVWNHTTAPTPDVAELRALAERYAEAAAPTELDVTNGAAWYKTWGDANDWSYGRYGVFDYTVELSEPKTPELAELGPLLDAHVEAAIAALTAAPTLSGAVRDADTGQPLDARIAPSAGGAFRTDPQTGAFYRLLPPGPVEIEVAASGYRTEHRKIGESDGPLDIALVPERIATGRLQPAVVGEPLRVRLPVWAEGLAWLDRAGSDPVALYARAGTVHIDPAQLSPGAWNLELAEGPLWPNAVLVPSADGPPIADLVWTAHTLEVHGGPFDEGARAWALGGATRALRPAAVAQPEPGRLELELPEDTEDVLILVGGAHVVAAREQGERRARELVAVGACTSAGGGHHGAHLLSVGLWGLWMTRRRRDRA